MPTQVIQHHRFHLHHVINGVAGSAAVLIASVVLLICVFRHRTYFKTEWFQHTATRPALADNAENSDKCEGKMFATVFWLPAQLRGVYFCRRRFVYVFRNLWPMLVHFSTQVHFPKMKIEFVYQRHWIYTRHGSKNQKRRRIAFDENAILFN